MLQQTRVEMARSYFLSFLERFPTVDLLAEAPLEEVLAKWSGLGYYRRARLLHRAAGQVVERGGFPQSAVEWKELAGVGEYTAAAIASIAFGEPVAVVDGNVERVVSRLRALAVDPKRGAGRRAIREAAAELLAREQPGEWNQAMMELGATLCAPRAPRCPECPLVDECGAASSGRPERFPVLERRLSPERIGLVAAVVEHGSRVLLFRRPDDESLLAGTWEVPWVEADERESAPETSFEKSYGGKWRLSPQLARVRHSVTRYRLEVWVHRATLAAKGTVGEGREAGWFNAEERRALPQSSLLEKILRQLPPKERIQETP